jgi:chromosome partitioning protein
MRVALVNIKGGVGKTTTAMHLGAALADGGRTMLVDCDPQQSAAMWSVSLDLPYTVTSRPAPDVARWLPPIAADYEHVVIDTPPSNLPIVKSAVMAADVVLVPCAPSGVEINRLAPTFEMLAEIEPIHPVAAGVLLNKMRYGTNSARSIREILAEKDYPVMATEIPLQEAYAASFGTVPVVTTVWRDLAKELEA